MTNMLLCLSTLLVDTSFYDYNGIIHHYTWGNKRACNSSSEWSLLASCTDDIRFNEKLVTYHGHYANAIANNGNLIRTARSLAYLLGRLRLVLSSVISTSSTTSRRLVASDEKFDGINMPVKCETFGKRCVVFFSERISLCCSARFVRVAKESTFFWLHSPDLKQRGLKPNWFLCCSDLTNTFVVHTSSRILVQSRYSDSDSDSTSCDCRICVRLWQ